MAVTFKDIENARTVLAGNVVRTPLIRADKLSDITGADIYVKFENLQVTSSFKDRGAYNKMSSLTDAERARGVIAMSAGNHAQAVAYHAKRLGIPATIVMPETTPSTKVERTRAHGAHVILSGETLAESQVTAETLVKDKGYLLIHPYDDDKVIAGQGTIAIEMLEDQPDLDVMVVPIGGGGIIGGTAIAAKHIKPDVEMLGVEVKLYPSMYHALRGQPAKCGGSTLAEGIAVKNVTERTITIAKQYVDDVRLVGESDIERAVMAYLTHQKTLAEGAGAAGLAAVFADPGHFRGRKVGLILCGGNIDPRILASIILRELEREHRIVNLRIQIDDRPGVLGRIATLLGQLGANILEVSHRRMFLDVPAKGAELEIMVETRDGPHADEIVARIEAEGFSTRVLDAPGGRETVRRG
ncbi:threonine ammonia-lyase [Taklimakanibacter albus]|uniref:Threonine ammonia-lyase n=1 Tax=Taklimakanibacter albus TaxID=2800327 RepID=A0ACC5R0W1_9HYPH|nr:threonine ammonia-lyase [Aestuariivirga sp. YIM B02566]MBK1866249.1 threonine ammonia-lyase [Aestuariivirga sp. YIM B02566]